MSGWFQQKSKYAQFLEIAYQEQKVIPAQAPQYRQHALISDFLDLAYLSTQEEAALATNWIKDRPEGLKSQNLDVGHQDGPIHKQFAEKSNCRRPLHHQRMRIFGLKETIDPSRESIGNCKGFFPACGSPSTSFFADCTSSAVCYFRATSVTILTSLQPAVNPFAWMLLWKTRSRPIGVRFCLVAQLDFLSTAFDPREWAMVVYWKEDSGRQLRLTIPENEGRDEANFPSPPRCTFFDDRDVPLNPPDTPLAPPGPPGPPDSPGLPPGLPPDPPNAGGKGRARAGKCIA